MSEPDSSSDHNPKSLRHAASSSMSAASTSTEGVGPFNLFDFTEQELLQDAVLTHYQVLHVPLHARPDEIKKAYRRASLKYHPDKTGRGEDDYVFLAVKAAHDTLSDTAARQAYDSTVVPFDDNIPPPREKLLQDDELLYNDESNFYVLFGPVFERNLRFDARLRPDAAKISSGSITTGSTNGSSKHGKQQKVEAPSLGDDTTDIATVHAFYEYWIHFESWRDFRGQAAAELEVDTDTAESRYEKRWLQGQIEKRAKQLKRLDMQRIQTLVERAMEADPRLRRERAAMLEAKKQQAAAKEAAAQQRKAHAAAQEAAAALKAEQEKQALAQAKQAREQAKKLLRKARQQVRKLVEQTWEQLLSSSTYRQPLPWSDAYDMRQDVELLCLSLSQEQLEALADEYRLVSTKKVDSSDRSTAPLLLIQERAQQVRSGELKNCNQDNDGADDEDGENDNDPDDDDNNNIKGRNGQHKSPSKPSPPSTLQWTKEELSALAKAVKKFPPGGGSRWDQITSHVNHLCKLAQPRTREECIDKYNQIARNAAASSSTASNTANKTSNQQSMGQRSTSCVSEAASTISACTATNASANDNANNNNNSDTTATATTTKNIDNNATDADVWTAEQDAQLETALAQYPAVTMDKNARWTAIAKAVTGKTKKECVARFKVIRDALKQQQQQA